MKGKIGKKSSEKKEVKSNFTGEIKTDVDRVVDMVGSSPKDKLSLRQLKKKLDLPYDIIEKWARILDEQNVLELVYPKNPFIGAYLKVRKVEYPEEQGGKVGKKEKTKKKELKERIKGTQKERVEKTEGVLGREPVAGRGLGKSRAGKRKAEIKKAKPAKRRRAKRTR